MIAARDVTVRAGRATLVDGVSLDVGAGELVALIGPNGAGKSTLLAALAGDVRLAAGAVRLDGRAVAAMSPRELAARRVVLPQRSALNAAYSALEVVQLGGGGVARARRLLDEVELGALADRAYPTLSGGEQQRVQLARVLAQLTDTGGGALLLDEPSAALDPRHTHLVLARARRAASDGHAVVAVLHDLSLAARWADRVALLHRGSLVASGRAEDVLTRDQLRAVFAIDFDRLAQPGGHLVLVPTLSEIP